MSFESQDGDNTKECMHVKQGPGNERYIVSDQTFVRKIISLTNESQL